MSQASAYSRFEVFRSTSSEEEGSDIGAVESDIEWPAPWFHCLLPVFYSQVTTIIYEVVLVLICANSIRILIRPDPVLVAAMASLGVHGHLLKVLAVIWIATSVAMIVQMSAASTFVRENASLHSMHAEMVNASKARQDFVAFNEFEWRFRCKIYITIAANTLDHLTSFALAWWVTSSWLNGAWLYISFLGCMSFQRFAGFFAGLALQSLAVMTKFHVGVFIEDLREVEKLGIVEGVWPDLVQKHYKFAERLKEACAGITVMFVAEIAALACYVLGLSNVIMVVEWVSVRMFALLAMAGVLLGVMLGDLRLPAEATEMCQSRAMGTVSINNVAASFYRSPGMSSQVRMEHGNFMQYLNHCEIGFEVPIVGMITIWGIMTVSKVIVTGLPVALSFVAREHL